MQTDQVHNRKQGKKKFAKLQARIRGVQVKKGFKSKKPKFPSKHLVKTMRAKGKRAKF